MVDFRFLVLAVEKMKKNYILCAPTIVSSDSCNVTAVKNAGLHEKGVNSTVRNSQPNDTEMSLRNSSNKLDLTLPRQSDVEAVMQKQVLEA